MKKGLFIIFIFLFQQGYGQSVFGYWYGYANVKTSSSANNYLVELVLQPEKGYVKGILNYYFKNTYRSIQVKGNYQSSNRQLNLYDIPVVYHGSHTNFEVDCLMNLIATLRVTRVGSNLVGSFFSLPEYKYTCGEIRLNLAHNADISKKDSVLRAISEFKENFQVWTPSYNDTAVAVVVEPRKVVNYVTENEFTKRENVVINEIEVETDTVRVDVYDNGEIDGDKVSVFYNKQLILYNQKLTHKSIHLNLALDSTQEYNEISMFAENLGLIAPNTALMRIFDGKKQHDIRVSSSLEKNAVIRIRKKKTATGQQ
jgi:hypothetical protein